MMESHTISLPEDILEIIWKTYYSEYVCKSIIENYNDKIDKLIKNAQVSHEYLIEQIQTSNNSTNFTLNFNHLEKSLLWAHTNLLF